MPTIPHFPPPVNRFLQKNPVLRRRILFMRQDDAPLKYLRGRHRAQVLIKLLEHPDSRAALEYMQELTQQGWPCDVLLEINPASMAQAETCILPFCGDKGSKATVS